MPKFSPVTVELLQKYDRPGPRYTSYPTAVEFSDEFDDASYRAHLAKANEAKDEPLSLYVHLPFCEERCSFCGCNVVVTKKRHVASDYLGFLHREIDMLAAMRAYREAGFEGVLVPDHTPRVAGDSGRITISANNFCNSHIGDGKRRRLPEHEKKFLIDAGRGVLLSGACRRLLEIAERTQIPVALTLLEPVTKKYEIGRASCRERV